MSAENKALINDSTNDSIKLEYTGFQQATYVSTCVGNEKNYKITITGRSKTHNTTFSSMSLGIGRRSICFIKFESDTWYDVTKISQNIAANYAMARMDSVLEAAIEQGIFDKELDKIFGVE
jgi:hypothetical protein